MMLDYFYGQSGKLFAYFRIPKALFQDSRFRQLSTDARTLYGILLDRMSLSAKNGWLDEQGRVYIIYTVREVQESLCCAEHKAVKLFRELEQADLIERKRRGLGKPSLIYVKNFSSGLPKAQAQNCANSNSCAAENAVQVQPKPQSNKTEKNKTERNHPFFPDKTDRLTQREQLEDYFYQALEVELLLRLCPDDEDTIYQIVDLLVDTCSTKREMLRIAGDDKPAEVVRSRLKKLNLGQKKPTSFAVRQYKLYKLAAGKTAKSILISCGARLAPFDIQELRDLTMYDELELDTLGDKKTALFLIMSDTDSTFNFLISMVYTQLFNLLCDKADDVYGGKLPIHVRCLIDEAANIGQIPNLEKLVATIRSREISACLVLQARSQLKAIYKDNADTIVGNMDSQLFLGGSDPSTLKELSEMLGKETIDSFNTSDTRGNSPSYSTSFQKLGHELLSRDEIAVLDGGKCILQLRGVRPFLSDKYDLTQHPNYKLTSDFDEKNRFDIEKYLNRKAKIHPGDEFIVVDADSLPSA